MFHPVRSFSAAAVAAVAIIALSACSPLASDDGDELSIYATTGYLADAVANIAPDARITTMVGPGGDPHTYQPSTRDIETIMNADLVFWNGLSLEAQMIDLLEGLGDRQLAVGEQIPSELLLDWPDTDGDGNALYDPHIWNSPETWIMVVELLTEKLADTDPAGADGYRERADDYIGQIREVDVLASELIATIPADARILITGHDAFAYFGDSYGLEVYATDFISTEAALSPRELSDLAFLIADNGVRVIFQDNQANPQAITSLSEAVRALGWQVEISDDELYADSLGAEPGVDSYLGVFEHNARAVAGALGTTP